MPSLPKKYQNNSVAESVRFQDILQDISNNIQINSDLSIIHSQDEPLLIPPDLKQYLRQISQLELEQYLTVRLQNYLYNIYYAYFLDENQNDGEARIFNQVDNWSETKFYQQLNQSNHGQGYFDDGWLIIKQESSSYWQVKKNNLSLYIDSQADLELTKSEEAPPKKIYRLGDLVAIKMPSNLVERGLYIAVGDGGSINNYLKSSEHQIVNLYFNITAEGAVMMMNSLTTELNKVKIPFHFQVPYNPENYNYSDAVILSFESNLYPKIHPIVKDIYQLNRVYFQSEVPLFTKLITPGIGLAEQPQSLESFPKNRCHIIAQGIIKARTKKTESSQVKMKYILKAFADSNISIKHPYLNPNSKDIYYPF